MPHDTDPREPQWALEELMFLARSQHRIALLRGLSEEELPRQELASAVDIPQPTLGRILGDFEERHWVSNDHNGGYALTPVGSRLAEELEDILIVLRAGQQVANIAASLPLDRFGFDLRHLASAEVIEPSTSDPLVHMRRFDELAAAAENVQVFSNVLACAPGSDGSGVHEEFLGHLDELIVTSAGLDTGLQNKGLREWLEERIEAGRITVHRFDGTAPYLMGRFDDKVGLVPIDESGVPTGLLETSNKSVQAWARQRFNELREGSSEITPVKISG